MRISDWSSDVCSSDLPHRRQAVGRRNRSRRRLRGAGSAPNRRQPRAQQRASAGGGFNASYLRRGDVVLIPIRVGVGARLGVNVGYMKIRSEEHTSELQSLMRISYAVFCLKKKITNKRIYK